MRGLDTPILLDLLRARPSAKKLLAKLRGEELGTTEINLFELEILNAREGGPGVERRRAALDRLRHRITVVPIDENGVRASIQLGTSSSRGIGAATRLIMGALAAAGCTELYTTANVAPAGKHGPIRIVRYA